MIRDISRPIHAKMALYPNNPSVHITGIREAAEGITALSEITLGSHTGTHLDAPLHIHANGAGPEAYGLEHMIGDAEVIEITSESGTISASDIPVTSASRVLLRTKNSEGDINVFHPEFVALSEDGAQELIGRNVRLIGIDGPSIKKKGVSDRVHEMLIDAGILIIEGLWLQGVPAGKYYLICLPLPIFHIDGVPVRAVLDSH